MAFESPGIPGPLPTGQVNLKSYLPGRKSTHPRLLDRTFLSPVKVTVFYKLAGSAALLDHHSSSENTKVKLFLPNKMMLGSYLFVNFYSFFEISGTP